MKIILLPGLDGTGLLFKPFIEALPDDMDTLLISYPVNEELSYAEIVDFVVHQLPNERFVLLGESFSGPIAYQVALLKPDKVVAVFFVATFLSSPRNFLVKLASFLPTNVIFSLPIPDVIIKSLLLGFSSDTKTVSLFRQAITQVSPRILSFRLREIAKLPNSHQLCGINSIYMQASDDRLVPKDCVKDFTAIFNNLKTFTLQGPHFILQANPVACAEIVVNEMRLITSHRS